MASSSSHADSFDLSSVPALLNGTISQCQIYLSGKLQWLLPGKLNHDSDAAELNQLLSQYRFRKNISATVLNVEVKGFINRKFVKEEKLRTSGQAGFSNQMTFPIVRLDRASGLREIIQTLREVDEEHAWVFLPSKNLWVDMTMLTGVREIWHDGVLANVLYDHYGNVEFYHTHPEKVIQFVQKANEMPFHHLVSGALPTLGDLLTTQNRAWNWNKKISFMDAVIHPLGVTYYPPTKSLRDCDRSELVDAKALGDLAPLEGDHEFQIRDLIREQVRRSITKGMCIEHDLDAFAIQFFSPSEFSKIDSWIAAHPNAR